MRIPGSNWIEIEPEDFDDEADSDGIPFALLAQVVDIRDGGITRYYGVSSDWKAHDAD